MMITAGGRWVPGLIALLALGTAQATLAAEWSVQHFEVVAAEPDMREVVRLNPVQAAQFALAGGPRDDRPTDPVLSSWLNDVGSRYRVAGHLPPVLEPVVDVGGVPTYRTFRFPYAGSALAPPNKSAAAGYNMGCGLDNAVPWLSMDGGQSASANTGQKRYLGALSHELMHALVAGDRLGDECNIHSYSVTEGIPNGASMYLYKIKFPNYTGKISTSRSAVGLRSYAIGLTYGDDLAPAPADPKAPGAPSAYKGFSHVVSGYGTGSMWFFIAERFGGLKVFPHFLASVLQKQPTEEDVLRWIENRLQTLKGLKNDSNIAQQRADEFPRETPGLYEVFPHFVTEFASYGGQRYFSWANTRFRSQQYARTSWLKYAFNGCDLYVVKPETRTAKISFTMARNSARCFRIKLEGFKGNVNTKMEVISDKLALLDQLHLGWAWKDGPGKTENCYEKREQLKSKWPPCVFKTFSQTGPSAGRYARTWPLEAVDLGAGGTDVERTYILSNVAVKPWTTQTYFDLELKIGATLSTVKGQPAEPVSPMRPPRTTTAPVKPKQLSELTRRDMYGLETDPPVRDDTIKGFSVLPYAPGRSEGGKAILQGGYAVQINNLDFGETGPVFGAVVPSDNPIAKDGGVVSSLFCKGASESPIGEVLQSDEDALVIKLKTDLCKAGPSTARQCETSGCPVVDNMTGEVNMAFGWRQFATTAPTDIITPGVRRYVATMPGSWQEAMRFGAGTALPEDDWPGAPGGNQTSPQGQGGGGSGGQLNGADCACSCEERKAFEDRGAALKAELDADGDPQAALAEVSGRMMTCNNTCRREYMICIMEEDAARKAEEDAAKARREEALTQACDCSCDALKELMTQGQAMEKDFAAQGRIDLEKIEQISHCMNACQQEMMGCL